jgi:23S rRNA (cytosine1962-C5)-methyltransferase
VRPMASAASNKESLPSYQSALGLLEAALGRRQGLIDSAHDTAFRIFNGHYEGLPGLTLDIYGEALLATEALERQPAGDRLARLLIEQVLVRLPWLRAVLFKSRRRADRQSRAGDLIFGNDLPEKVREGGLWYAIDLQINQDPSLYLDTRNLRQWLQQMPAGARVLNTFAYSGSLGIAALSSGADWVLQVDRNRRFLGLARRSCSLNHLPQQRMQLWPIDFFHAAGRLRRQRELFGVVLLDPPFQATGAGGQIDLVGQGHSLINKVRPLVADGGSLVVVNNALYLPGQAYLQLLEDLCSDGYMTIESIIPVPQDVTGYPDTVRGSPPSDPAPFNHSTKIVVLRVRRKDGLRSKSGHE